MHFHVVVVQVTAKKCIKKHDVRAKLLFFHSKPIAFLTSLCRRRPLLKLPIFIVILIELILPRCPNWGLRS